MGEDVLLFFRLMSFMIYRYNGEEISGFIYLFD